MVRDLLPVAQRVAARPRRARERRARRATGRPARRRTERHARVRWWRAGRDPGRRVGASRGRCGRSTAFRSRRTPGAIQHLYLDICPPALQTVSAGPHRRDPAAAPGRLHRRDRPPCRPGLARDDPRPLVYLTLGTVQNRPDVLRTVVAALAELDVRLLVTVGPQGDPSALGAAAVTGDGRALGLAGGGPAAVRRRRLARRLGHRARGRGARAAAGVPAAGCRPVPQHRGCGARRRGTRAAPGRRRHRRPSPTPCRRC